MTFSTQKNIAYGYRKARYRYLAFELLFHFLVIFFHVYICETYATLDMAEGVKESISH